MVFLIGFLLVFVSIPFIGIGVARYVRAIWEEGEKALKHKKTARKMVAIGLGLMVVGVVIVLCAL